MHFLDENGEAGGIGVQGTFPAPEIWALTSQLLSER